MRFDRNSSALLMSFISYWILHSLEVFKYFPTFAEVMKFRTSCLSLSPLLLETVTEIQDTDPYLYECVA